MIALLGSQAQGCCMICRPVLDVTYGVAAVMIFEFEIETMCNISKRMLGSRSRAEYNVCINVYNEPFVHFGA
jgi:hypothetical protein